MIFTIRPLHLPEDYAALAELLTIIKGAPVTAQSLQEEDSQIPTEANLSRDQDGRLTGFARLRLLAVFETDSPLGYAAAWRAPWTPPGAICSLFGVHPDARNHSIGKALVQALTDWARSIGAELLMGELPDRPAGVERFIEKAGFQVDAYVQEYVLDLTAWQPKSTLPEIEGLRLFTLADRPGEETERQLYDLYLRTLADNPGHLGGLPPFEAWREEAIPAERCSPEMVFLAAVDDRLVGVTTLFRTEESDLLYTDYTGVDRSVRGKGVARALKEWSFAAARDLGARRMITETEASNVPMRQLNLRLGYVVQDGVYRIIKRLD